MSTSSFYGTPNPLMGAQAVPVSAPRAPAGTDLGYGVGQFWIFQPSGQLYFLANISAGVANWIAVGTGPGSVNTINGVAPTAGNINLIDQGNVGAITITPGASPNVGLGVNVDGSTIVITGTAPTDRLSVANTVVQSIGPTNVAAPFDALGTIIAIPAGSAYYFEADVIGSDGAGLTHVVGGKQQAIIQNLGGVISVIGLQNQFYAENPSPVPAGQQDFEFVAAVGGAQLRVFGFNGVPMNFKARISYVAIP